MKQLTTFLVAVMVCNASMSQTDTTKSNDTSAVMKAAKSDTIRIGNILIIKKGKISDKNNDDVDITMGRKHRERKQNANISTNWGIIDLGFSNYIDNTNYGATGNYIVNRPGFPDLNKNDFKI